MNRAKKRKVGAECRIFKKEWTAKYFFTEVGSKAVCLLCNENMAAMKEYNINRHYTSKHIGFGSNLSTAEREKKATELQDKLVKQQHVFCKINIEQQAATEASFVVAHNIAKHSKPFSDAEFVKQCIMDVAERVCPESKQKLEGVSLSRRTVARRIEAIDADLKSQLSDKVKSFNWFSLALDESTDIDDTAQLLIFVRGISDNFQITEELLSMESMKDTTTGDDLLDSVKNAMQKFELPWGKLISYVQMGVLP